MSSQRRPSTLSNARYSPLSRLFSPIISLTRIIRGTYRPNNATAPAGLPDLSVSVEDKKGREEADEGGSIDSDPDYIPSSSSSSSSSSDSSDAERSGSVTSISSPSSPLPLPSSAHSSDTAESTLYLWIEEGTTTDPDYTPPSSSSPLPSSDSTTESSITYIYISSNSTHSVGEVRPVGPAGEASVVQGKCARWAGQSAPRVELEPGEIIEAPEILTLSSSSAPPSELVAEHMRTRVRTYNFGASFVGGRLKFEPPLPGPPSINRWMYQPICTGPVADNARAIGDIDFNPAPGGGLEYYVYSEAPGYNDTQEYCWIPCRIGGAHPHIPHYVLSHIPEHAPFWSYQSAA
ncbi:hypothetical protein FRC09_018049 [Ceratobasidium sp. 395]|nr:hypothetical protein FRC09_018049 [Ceratobasidium sp. 395]